MIYQTKTGEKEQVVSIHNKTSQTTTIIETSKIS
jgi:hypothetical protein